MIRFLGLFLILSTAVSSCPFCSTIPLVATAQKLLRENEGLVLARPQWSGEDDARFTVATVLKGKGVAPGQVIPIARRIVFGATRTYLLHTRDGDFTKARLTPVDPGTATFLRGVAKLPPATDEDKRLVRLRFFMKYLGDRNRLIAASVAQEFTEAPYATVKALRPDIDLARIVRAMEDEKSTKAHRGLGFLLVGIHGEEEGRETLGRWLADEDVRGAAGLDGLLGAYVLVHGKKGLDHVENLRPGAGSTPRERRWYSHNWVRALDFHAREESVVPRADVIAALVELTDDVETVVPAIEELTNLKHWASLELVVGVRQMWARDRRSVERATRAFLQACPDPEARKHIGAIRRRRK